MQQDDRREAEAQKPAWTAPKMEKLPVDQTAGGVGPTTDALGGIAS